MPVISVVIPAYNIEQYIGRSIESALNQTAPPHEIIVIDDGSTDNTAEVIKKYESVKYIYQENVGVSAARNRGIEEAKGDWIAFLDADDEWMEDKLKLQIEILQSNPCLMWVMGNFLRCLCSKKQHKPDTSRSTLKTLLKDKTYFDISTKGISTHIDTMLIKKEVFKKTGKFEEGKSRFEDLDMWFRIAFHYPKIGYVAEPTAIYHMNIENSLMEQKKYNSAEIFTSFLEKNLQAAHRTNRVKDFKPCAQFLVRQWTRAKLFEEQPEEIRSVLRKFKNLFTLRYKFTMRLLTAFPKTTSAGCRLISVIVRKLKLRKKTVRPPQ